MATPKKKHLIEFMIEAGVKWPDGAEYAAQDKYDLHVWFYSEKPKFAGVNKGKWTGDVDYESGRKCLVVDGEKLNTICCDWHRTIVTREQYEKTLADTSVTPTAQPSPEYCASVMRQMPDNTIEQLTADYHTKTAEAQRQQIIADEARKAADDALLALQKAGELIGLVISAGDFQKDAEQHQQPIITDWHDLQVGDVIECTAYNDKKDDPWPGGWATQNIGTQQVVSKINDSNGKISIKDSQDSGYAFKFIRRP